MPLLTIAAPAHAHGGEDHGTSAAPVVPPADGLAVSAASGAFEAMLHVPDAPPNTPVEATLLLADYATSAPVEGATLALTLSGPASVQADLGSAGSPGVYHGAITLPAHGDYAGALVVTTPATSAGPGASDVLAITGLHFDPPAADPVVSSDVLAAGAGVVVLLVATALFGVLVGWLLGRRRGAAAAAALLAGTLAVRSQQVEAHGGEDHGGTTAAPVAAGGALTLPMDGQFLVGLRTTVLARDLFQERVPALGRFVARPGEAATLGAPVDGVLVAPPGGFPRPGQAVEAGDTLALLRELPTAADRATVAQERSDAATRVAEARTALALAERDAAAIDSLGNALSERDRVALRGNVDIARTALREAEASLASFSNGVTVPIRAPLSGRLGTIEARPGDQVSAGSPLFRVLDPAGLWLEADVPERLALGLVEGAAAEVIAAAAPDRALSAVVLDAGQEADPVTGAVRVTLAVEGGDLGLRPGMGATAWIGRGPARDALVAPAAAVVESNGARLAFVKTGPERFEARELRLGARAGGRWEVLGGLAPGERVVVDGTYTLRSLAGR